MGFFSRLTAPLARMTGTPQVLTQWRELTARERYEMLERYYDSNGMYDDSRQAAKAADYWSPLCVELRNAVTRAVEFYPALLWPGTLPDSMPINVKSEQRAKAVTDAIHQVWKWSNWSTKKQTAARFIAMYGDLFLTVRVKRDRDKDDGKVTGVYLSLANPKDVTDFRLDERGVVTSLRFDEPLEEVAGQTYWYTEAWNEDGCRIWKRHIHGYQTALSSFESPDKTKTWKDLGFDFIPWVHAPFRDVSSGTAGNQRGLALVWPDITKIDATNNTATRLHSLMYKYGKPDWIATANQVDKQGRPMPAPRMEGESTNDRIYSAASNRVDVGESEVYRVPGVATLEPVVPNINWQAHLDLLNSDIDEIKADMPELRWYDLAQAGIESGVALMYRMTPALSRLMEVRGNCEAALIRAQEMALSMGVAYGVIDKGVGAYDAGDFDHSFEPREALMSDPKSLGETAAVYVDMGVPKAIALRKYARWSEADVADLPADAPVTQAGGTVTPATLVAQNRARAEKTAVNLETATQRATAAISKGGLAGVVNGGAIPKIVEEANRRAS